MTAPVFCAAHLLESWDDALPQVAFVQLAGTGCPVRAEASPRARM